MQSQWNDHEAAQFGADPLGQRVYTSRLLGRESSLVLHGGGNTSVKAAATNVFGVYAGGAFGELRLTRPTVPKALDVDILHDVIIERALGITREDIATGRYLHFSQSPEHVIEDVDRGKDLIGFLMNPIRPEEMFPRVLRGNRMPQKSTYFHPKTLSGLVMYRIARSSLGE